MTSQASDSKAPNAPKAGRTQPLVEALVRLLRPLVRLLVAEGITYPYLSDMLKRVYVDVADRDFRLPDKAQTASRVSLLSGVHRKDVRRFLEQGPEPGAVPRAVSLGARLVSEWMASDEYTDAEGRPLALPRTTGDAKQVSFERLVERVHHQDVRPRAVLDELVRVGVVHVDDNDVVHLDTGAFVPKSNFEELAYYFGRNLRDHIAAAAHNVAGDAEPFPERAAYYDRLSAESVAELRRMSRELSMDVLRKVNAEAARLAVRDENKDMGDRRITLGFYWLDALDEASRADDAAGAGGRARATLGPSDEEPSDQASVGTAGGKGAKRARSPRKAKES